MGLYNRDCSIFGSILGSPYFEKLPAGIVRSTRGPPALVTVSFKRTIFVHDTENACERGPVGLCAGLLLRNFIVNHDNKEAPLYNINSCYGSLDLVA